ncbi:hypothetical protein [Herpetosiphon giganteus]|uniref:hypothetical protein n=1 Tax=Herpetosiphon giganteus TaxID=2029754 RepID=UPI00195DB592|nr:hypothetical protein [Herpetosiphon giganteus]MBM7843780.1 rubrerythrin [Herpetosiphon giganteus]
MRSFNIMNSSDFTDPEMNAVRTAMNAAKEGKPYAWVQYRRRETITYYIPEYGESADYLIALIDRMVVADPRIQTATVLNAHYHILWTVERNTQHGQLIEQATDEAGSCYACWECGHSQATTFWRCPRCLTNNTCQPSTLRGVSNHRVDHVAQY